MNFANWIQRSGIPGSLLACGLLATILFMVFRFKSDAKQIAAVAATFLLAAIILYFPSLKSVKLGALDAELQDRIDAAGASIAQLQAVSTYSIKQTLFSSAIRDGREKAFATREDAIKLLRDLGASEKQIDDSIATTAIRRWQRNLEYNAAQSIKTKQLKIFSLHCGSSKDLSQR